MAIILVLIPVSLLLGAIGLAAFIWMLRHHQFDDLKGDAERVLSKEYDDAPKP